MEEFVEEWAFKVQVGSAPGLEVRLSWDDRINRGLEAVRKIVSKVWVYILIGIVVGVGIHGYVPEDFMASFMGKGVVVVRTTGGDVGNPNVL